MVKMKYEIKLNQNKVGREYVKVPFEKKQYIIAGNLVSIPQKLYEKLMREQPDNFLFYEDGKLKITFKKEEVNKTSLKGTIEKKVPIKEKKNIFKKTLDKFKGE